MVEKRGDSAVSRAICVDWWGAWRFDGVALCWNNGDVLTG